MQNKNMLASTLFLFVGFTSMAQGETPPPPVPPVPVGTPIDGGIIVLLLAAFSYGVYIAYSNSKRKV